MGTCPSLIGISKSQIKTVQSRDHQGRGEPFYERASPNIFGGVLSHTVRSRFFFSLSPDRVGHPGSVPERDGNSAGHH